MRDALVVIASDLPPVLATIAAAASETIALKIARKHGGTRVVMPVAPGDNWLTEIAGDEAAAAIIEAIGPARRLDMPLGPEGGHATSRRQLARQFQELSAQGASEADMARALGVTGRTIRNRRAAQRARRADTRQGDLFGEH